MRNISVKQVETAVAQLCEQANFKLGLDIVNALKRSIKYETSSLGKATLKALIENAKIARRESIPICQDTGTAVVFLKVGQDVHFTGGNLTAAIQRGVARGYRYLRKSIVASPLQRENTRDNTPAIIHYEIGPGNKVHITVSAKGAGSENSSALKMFKPSDGFPAIKKFVVEQIKQTGASACPPLIVGIGIGGNFKEAPTLAKKALLRPVGQKNRDPKLAKLERELLKAINLTGVGPAGFGGKTTALAVHIVEAPCHIASLPVAINIGCHANRHKEIIL